MREYINSPPSKVLGDLRRRIPKNVKITFCATFIAGVLVHGYLFANFLLNHDGMSYFRQMAAGNTPHTLTSGRWFQGVAIALSGAIPVPWVIGFLSVFYLSLTAAIVVACLEVKRPLYSVLVGLILVTFPAAGVVFAYIQVADSVFLSVLLACFAVLLCKKFRFGFIFGAFSLALSLAIVQTYITLAAGLFVMMLILDILSKQESIKTLLLRGLKYVSCLVLGLAVYFSVLQYMLTTRGVTLSGYQGIDQMGQLPLYRYPRLIELAYQEFFGFFTQHSYGFLSTRLPFILPLILIPLIIVLLVINKRPNKRSIPHLILLAVLVALFPAAVNAIYIMGAHFVYLMLLYALALVFVLMAALSDRLDLSLQDMKSSVKKYIGIFVCWVSLAVLVFVPYNYFVVLNGNYLQTDLAIRQTTHVSSTLVQRVRAFPGYEDNMPVVLVGRHSAGSDAVISQLHEHSPMFGFPTTNGLINWHSYRQFFEIFLGEDINLQFLRDDTIRSEHYEALSELTIFPADGSMMIADGMLFIRVGPEF
ncbi:MAG: glucosyltransferase domain-containing protein [Oscillospiraceae bacterium]|nr:glucosyltransferase domain-containing protein [Oscillospiraceae bacterium]